MNVVEVRAESQLTRRYWYFLEALSRAISQASAARLEAAALAVSVYAQYWRDQRIGNCESSHTLASAQIKVFEGTDDPRVLDCARLSTMITHLGMQLSLPLRGVQKCATPSHEAHHDVLFHPDGDTSDVLTCA